MAGDQRDSLHMYARNSISNNSIKKLGEALAAERKLNEVETGWYRAFTSDISDRTEAATAAVTGLLRIKDNRAMLPRVAEARVTGRPKTRKTLIEKLQRTPEIKLPAVRDAAGVRVVGAFTVFEQQQAIGLLRAGFDHMIHTSREAEVVDGPFTDRLAVPMFGYRALHLVAWPEGRPVEVQVRTDLQHAWAEIMEKLCDRWGRETRYGNPVNHPDDQERDRRQSIVDQLIAISSDIETFESEAGDAGLAHVHPPITVMQAAGIDVHTIEAAQNSARALEPELDSTKQNLLRALAQFGVDANPDLDM